MTGRAWYDERRRRAAEEIADGLVLLATTESAPMVIDVYENPHSEGPAALSSASGRDLLQHCETLLPYAGSGPVDLAWEVESPSAMAPRDRVLEAFLQGHLRARERLTGEPGWRSCRAPTDSPLGADHVGVRAAVHLEVIDRPGVQVAVRLVGPGPAVRPPHVGDAARDP